MPISSDHKQVLAMALAEARMPKRPQLGPMDYGHKIALARAEAGSDLDARVLLTIAAAGLRSKGPIPFDQYAILPNWLAELVARAIESLAKSKNPAAAVGRKRTTGQNSVWDNAQRDAAIAWVADSMKAFGHRDYWKRTAELLASVDFPPPGGGNSRQRLGWSAESVKDSVRAHRSRGAIR